MSEVKIGLIGKYIELKDAYKSIAEAFIHAGVANECKLNIEWIHSEKIEEKPINGLQKIDYLFKNVVNHLIAHPDDNGCLLVNAAAEMSKQCFKTQQVICNNKDEVQDLLTNWLNDAQNSKVLKLSTVSKASLFLLRS